MNRDDLYSIKSACDYLIDKLNRLNTGNVGHSVNAMRYQVSGILKIINEPQKGKITKLENELANVKAELASLYKQVEECGGGQILS